jgi:hypothetical protein
VAAPFMALADLAALPVNYFIEFGFYSVVLVLVYLKSRGPGQRSSADTAVFVIGGTALFICTFVRSGVIGNNDLGWRGMLIAQFFLLYLAIGYVGEWRSRKWGRTLGCLFVLGILATVYELTAQRLQPVLADAGLVVAEDGWEGPQKGIGARTYSLRRVYEQVNKEISSGTVIQHNPIRMQNIPSGLYGDRQRALMGSMAAGGYSVLGGSLVDEEAASQIILDIFRDASGNRIDALCDRASVRLLYVGSDDPLWSNRESWVWRREPFAVAPDARAFRCGGKP